MKATLENPYPFTSAPCNAQPSGIKFPISDDKTKRVAYNEQTQEAQAKGKSNCPLAPLR